MVGFPGETRQDFHKSLELLDSVLFDSIEVYRYSARPGTQAAELDHPLPEATIKQRYNRIFVKSLINMTKKRMLKNAGRRTGLFNPMKNQAKLSAGYR